MAIMMFASLVVEMHIRSSGRVASAATVRSWSAGATRAVQVLLTDHPCDGMSGRIGTRTFYEEPTHPRPLPSCPCRAPR